MQEYLRRQQARQKTLEQVAEQQKFTAFLHTLDRNKLAIQAFPLTKCFNEYSGKQWLQAWDNINQHILTPTSKKVHILLETAIEASEHISDVEYAKLVQRLKSMVEKFDKCIFEFLEPHNDNDCYQIYEQLRMLYQDPIIPLSLQIYQVIFNLLSEPDQYQAPQDSAQQTDAFIQRHTQVATKLFCESDFEGEDDDEDQSSLSVDEELELFDAPKAFRAVTAACPNDNDMAIAIALSEQIMPTDMPHFDSSEDEELYLLELSAAEYARGY